MCPTKQPQSAWLAEQELGCLLLTAFFYVHVLDAARPHNCIWSCALAAAGCLNTAFRLHIFSAPPSSPPPRSPVERSSAAQASPRRPPPLSEHVAACLHGRLIQQQQHGDACIACIHAGVWSMPSPPHPPSAFTAHSASPGLAATGALRCLSREPSVAPGCSPSKCRRGPPLINALAWFF